jgi:hypothetical protein
MIGLGKETRPAAAGARADCASRDGARSPSSNGALEEPMAIYRRICENGQALWDTCQIIGLHVFDMLLTPPRWQGSEIRKIISRSILARPRRGADSSWRIVRPTDFTRRT